jgi:hypothetical protein
MLTVTVTTDEALRACLRSARTQELVDELIWRRRNNAAEQDALFPALDALTERVLRRPLAKAAVRRPGARGDVSERMRQLLAERGGGPVAVGEIAADVKCHRTSVQKAVERHRDVFTTPSRGKVALKRPAAV